MAGARRARARSETLKVSGSRYGRAAVQSELMELDEAPDKRKKLVKVARRVGELLGGNELDDRDKLEQLLLDAGLQNGLDPAWLRRSLPREIDRGASRPQRAPAIKGARLRDRADARDRTLAWEAGVRGDHWRGRGSAMTLKLLEAFGRISLRAGKVRFGASYRQLAEEAHMSLQSVAKYLPATRKFVRQVQRGSPFSGESSEWQLIEHRCGIGKQPAFTGTMASGLFASAPSPVADDENRFHGRPNARWLSRLLANAEQPPTIADLARVTGLDRKTVSRNLSWLAGDGLAGRDDEGHWSHVQPTEPYAAMVDFAASRRARYRDDRARYDRWREAHARPLDR